jgi:hypothetical protein
MAWRNYKKNEDPKPGDVVSLTNELSDSFSSCIVIKVHKDGSFDVARPHAFVVKDSHQPAIQVEYVYCLTTKNVLVQDIKGKKENRTV